MVDERIPTFWFVFFPRKFTLKILSNEWFVYVFSSFFVSLHFFQMNFSSNYNAMSNVAKHQQKHNHHSQNCRRRRSRRHRCQLLTCLYIFYKFLWTHNDHRKKNELNSLIFKYAQNNLTKCELLWIFIQMCTIFSLKINFKSMPFARVHQWFFGGRAIKNETERNNKQTERQSGWKQYEQWARCQITTTLKLFKYWTITHSCCMQSEYTQLILHSVRLIAAHIRLMYWLRLSFGLCFCFFFSISYAHVC